MGIVISSLSVVKKSPAVGTSHQALAIVVGEGVDPRAVLVHRLDVLRLRQRPRVAGLRVLGRRRTASFPCLFMAKGCSERQYLVTSGSSRVLPFA